MHDSHIATVAECDGCRHQQNKGTCDAYVNPGAWWRNGKSCPLATHLMIEATKDKRVRVGQQKHRKGMK